MPSPIVIHVLRPYANEEEYLERERTSIGARSMLLVDQPALPLDTSVIFDVTLANGQRPIRAEGKVLGYEPPSADSAGGLRVRFKRFGAATKAFIDRAVNASPAAAAALNASLIPTPLEAAAAAAGATEQVPLVVGAAAPTVPALPESTVEETSGVHRKAVLPVAAPVQREALLQRLRARRTG